MYIYIYVYVLLIYIYIYIYIYVEEQMNNQIFFEVEVDGKEATGKGHQAVVCVPS